MKPKTQEESVDLARLANILSTWVEVGSEHYEYCRAWADYWIGDREMPGKGIATGTPRKDSDFHVYSDALACVTFGWSGRVSYHIERVQRRMRENPLLDKFPLAARVGVPQVREGKE